MIFLVEGVLSQDGEKECDSYDIRRNIWVILPDLNYKRYDALSVDVNNKFFYVFGGTYRESRIYIMETATEEGK